MRSSRKIGWVALVAATYAIVAGGPFGLEEIVQTNGYRGGLFIICLTPLLWALPTTLMVSELASALPETGGYYIWVKRALGPFWGFQQTWLAFAGSIFDMALYPILFSTYLGHLVPSLGKGHWPFFLGIGMIAICVIMNLLGTRFVGEGSIVFVLAVLAPFAFLVWYGISAPHLSTANPTLAKTDFFGGILIAMWNYMGWDNSSTIAGDVENAPRTYARSMTAALAVVALSYIVSVVGVARAGIPAGSWETGSWVTFAGLLGGQKLAVCMTAAGMVAAMSTFNADAMTLSRLPFAMARDGFLPKVFAKENARGAPWVAIVVCSIFWTMATALGFEASAMIDVLVTGLSILLQFAALIALRVKEPNLARPFRIRGGLAGVMLLSVPPTALIVVSGLRNHAERIGPVNAFTIGLGFVLLGVACYWFGKQQMAGAAAVAPLGGEEER